MSRALRLSLLLALPAISAWADEPVHAADVYAQLPILRELLSDVIFWANFEGTPRPVWGRRLESPGDATIGEFAAAPGLVGQAMVSVEGNRCRYPAEGNLDLTRPGAISCWVCPVAWDRVQPTGIRNNLFGSPFSKQGYFGVNHAAARMAGGMQVQSDAFLFYAENFPGASRTYIQLGAALGPEWENGLWHLIVVNWKGALFEVSMDGGGLRSGNLGVPIDPSGVHELHVGGCQERTLIDEFMVYRRPLAPAEIAALYNSLIK